MMNEKILLAIGGIDDAVIRDAKEKTGLQRSTRPIPLRRLVSILVAAVMILVFAGTVVAVSIYGADWFKAFFAEQSGGPLNTDQEEYIENNTDIVGVTDEQGGYLVTVESAIYDGKMAIIKLKVTAPEDVALDQKYYHFQMPGLMVDGQGGRKYAGSIGMQQTEDTDDLTNTVDILIKARITNDVVFYTDAQWQLKLYNFAHGGTTPETYSKIVQSGVWQFDLEFDIRDGMRELVAEPVDAWGLYDMRYTMDVPIRVTSLRLSALSMEVVYEYPDPENHLGALDMWDVRVVMKDGSEVQAWMASGQYEVLADIGRIFFDMTAPIEVEDVAYVLLYNGVKIPMSSAEE